AQAQPTKGEDEAAALVAEGRAALRASKLDDAAKALDQAIELNPRRVDAYVLRAAAFSAGEPYRLGGEGVQGGAAAEAGAARGRRGAGGARLEPRARRRCLRLRAAAPAGGREGAGAIRRAAAARPSLARCWPVAGIDRGVRGVLRAPPTRARAGRYRASRRAR